jgi:hypothetical protein
MPNDSNSLLGGRPSAADGLIAEPANKEEVTRTGWSQRSHVNMLAGSLAPTDRQATGTSFGRACDRSSGEVRHEHDALLRS